MPRNSALFRTLWGMAAQMLFVIVAGVENARGELAVTKTVEVLQ